uniref:Uncharacterized protein n=1 Tax=Anguilla anguilla TaxID=7936 RepID=A0A0E9V8B3_ANGAN
MQNQIIYISTSYSFSCDNCFLLL